MRFRVVVKNQGTGTVQAGEAFRVALLLDDDPNAVGVARLDTALPPGASVLLTVDEGENGGRWFPTAGAHRLQAKVDDLEAIVESNEGNNLSAQQSITVGTAPLDTDQDGLPDAEEVLAGTDANDPASLLRILSAHRTDESELVVRWSSVAGKEYSMAWKENVEEFEWVTLPGVITATGSTTSWTKGKDAIDLQGLLRVQVLP